MQNQNEFLPIATIKKLFPDEWVILGNPEITNQQVVGGIVLYHDKNIKQLPLIAKRDVLKMFKQVTHTFIGEVQSPKKYLL